MPHVALEFRQFLQALHPRGVVRVPAKIDRVQCRDPLGRHVRLLVLLPQRVVPALLLDPQSELGVVRILHGNVAVPVLFAKGGQIGQVSGPRGLLGVPRETDLVEQRDPLGGDGGAAVFGAQLVLLPLLRHPRRQPRVERPPAGNHAVAVLGPVLEQLVVRGHPLGVLLAQLVGLWLLFLLLWFAGGGGCSGCGWFGFLWCILLFFLFHLLRDHLLLLVHQLLLTGVCFLAEFLGGCRCCFFILSRCDIVDEALGRRSHSGRERRILHWWLLVAVRCVCARL